MDDNTLLQDHGTREDISGNSSAGWLALEQHQCNDNKDSDIDESFSPCPSLTSSLIIVPSSVSYLGIYFHMCVNQCRHQKQQWGSGTDPLPPREMKLQVIVMTTREGASITVDFINHVVKCQRAEERLGPLDLRVCMCVCCSAKGKEYKYHKTQKLSIKDWRCKSFYRISRPRFDLYIVVKSHSHLAITDTF